MKVQLPNVSSEIVGIALYLFYYDELPMRDVYSDYFDTLLNLFDLATKYSMSGLKAEVKNDLSTLR